jgi:hypothetical protein
VMTTDRADATARVANTNGMILGRCSMIVLVAGNMLSRLDDYRTSRYQIQFCDANSGGSYTC